MDELAVIGGDAASECGLAGVGDPVIFFATPIDFLFAENAVGDAGWEDGNHF